MGNKCCQGENALVEDRAEDTCNSGQSDAAVLFDEHVENLAAKEVPEATDEPAASQAELVVAQPVLERPEAKVPESADAKSAVPEAVPAGSKYCVSIEKADKAVGLKVDMTPDDRIFIVSVLEGSRFESWNFANPEKAVMIDDGIVKVNGLKDVDMMKTLLDIATESSSPPEFAPHLEVLLYRPKKVKVSIRKDGEPIGIHTATCEHLHCLILEGIAEGSRFSASNDAGVKVGDHITHVNGFRGPPLQLVEKMKAEDPVEFTICCY
eukprot:TRINITY_DN32948_c0_g1_i1.p1 TRINITY_DN32948_c0_g1~~TRINITY_DN32948_c0_g1_i1.p1  ORF type:complete len:280 (-),score=50.46 TRINITY_DN32948_c0_g1_i1:90-887(-)